MIARPTTISMKKIFTKSMKVHLKLKTLKKLNNWKLKLLKIPQMYGIVKRLMIVTKSIEIQMWNVSIKQLLFKKEIMEPHLEYANIQGVGETMIIAIAESFVSRIIVFQLVR